MCLKAESLLQVHNPTSNPGSKGRLTSHSQCQFCLLTYLARKTKLGNKMPELKLHCQEINLTQKIGLTRL